MHICGRRSDWAVSSVVDRYGRTEGGPFWAHHIDDWPVAIANDVKCGTGKNNGAVARTGRDKCERKLEEDEQRLCREDERVSNV